MNTPCKEGKGAGGGEEDEDAEEGGKRLPINIWEGMELSGQEQRVCSPAGFGRDVFGFTC